MSIPSTPEPIEPTDAPEDFASALKSFDQSQAQAHTKSASSQILATVVALTADAVLLDIGYKTEGTLPLSDFANEPHPAVGDQILVSSRGRNPEGYYDLSRHRVEQPKDWASLEAAFAAKAPIAGTVTAVVKGGLTVDVGGLRAFLPASRSGTRDAAALEALVGQPIRCRITKLDTTDEDLVVDRRSVLEEEEAVTRDRRFSEVHEGDILPATVRSFTPFGAFLDLGGIDGLLHIGEISWSRIAKPEDALTLGQQLRVKVLKIDPASHRLSLSLKQLEPHPWDAVPSTFKVGERIRGPITRLTDFGAFLELTPGVEGMIHVSEMSWIKKVRKPADILTPGQTVEAVILSIDAAAQRIALGLKQTLGDPWADVPERFPVHSIHEANVASFTPFGAFVELAEGIQGLVHISEIVPDRRLNHPQDELRVNQKVRVKILEFDPAKRQLKLSIKQAIPTSLDDFLLEHHVGDTVTGRIVDLTPTAATVELGEGILATSTLDTPPAEPEAAAATPSLDLSTLTSMLNARWKGNEPKSAARPETMYKGQLRTFRIATLNPEARVIELTPQ